MSYELLQVELDNNDAAQQAQRFKFFLYAMGGSAVHTVICLFYFINDYFRGDFYTFASLFGVIWAVNLALTYIMLSGFNMRFRHPDLLVPQLFISATAIIASTYYIEGFGLSVMMLFFGMMLLGASRIALFTFLSISIYASAGYGYVLFKVVQDFPTEVTVSVEILGWLSFTVMALTFSVTGTRIGRLQKSLSSQNEELNSAFEKLKAIARQDELTGMNNRRYVMQLLDKQIHLAEQPGYQFVVCYCDLDHFKSVNDTFGHSAGDEVLKRFSASVLEQIRNVDIAGRLGGEEFIVVLSGNDCENAEIVLDRIREKVEHLDFSDIAEGLSITVSMGMTAYRKGEPINETLVRADELLYKAKEEGRNRIVGG